MPRHAPPLSFPEEIALWNKIVSHAGETLTTSWRGSKPGIPFTYTVKGAEMFVSSRSKSITQSTVLLAYRKVIGNCVTPLIIPAKSSP